MLQCSGVRRVLPLWAADMAAEYGWPARLIDEFRFYYFLLQPCTLIQRTAYAYVIHHSEGGVSGIFTSLRSIGLHSGT